MTLKLYFDLMSQPSRALYILLKSVNCQFQPCLVDLRKGEHMSEEYTKIYKLQKVPIIEHNGFVLGESIAILRYLSNEGLIPSTLYPTSGGQSQARVDEFLEWQHIGLRLHLSMYFRVKHMNPIFTGKQPEPKCLAEYEGRMANALQDLNDIWLAKGTKFLTGDNITVADLWAACEVEQPRMAGYDPEKKFSNIAAWMKLVRQHFSPYYEEAHVILNKIVAKRAAKL